MIIDGPPPSARPTLGEVSHALAFGSLASNASLTMQDDGSRVVHGDPSDVAFLVPEAKGASVSTVRRSRFRRVAEVPFTAERRLTSSIEADLDRQARLTVVTKGAPDVLLARCTQERLGVDVRPLTDERRREILAAVERLTGQAMRTLAVAYRSLDTEEVPANTESLEHRLVYVGTVGIVDPPRPEAKTAVAEAHRTGIRVVMITGDHPHTAASIATELGIIRADTDHEAVTGAELDQLNEEAMRRTVRERSVYARVAPEHKLRLVDALQADGSIVAMTGDGVNDAPALKSADIGINCSTASTPGRNTRAPSTACSATAYCGRRSPCRCYFRWQSSTCHFSTTPSTPPR